MRPEFVFVSGDVGGTLLHRQVVQEEPRKLLLNAEDLQLGKACGLESPSKGRLLRFFVPSFFCV